MRLNNVLDSVQNFYRNRFKYNIMWKKTYVIEVIAISVNNNYKQT